jgi:hypothetical protein
MGSPQGVQAVPAVAGWMSSSSMASRRMNVARWKKNFVFVVFAVFMADPLPVGPKNVQFDSKSSVQNV